MIAKKWGLSRTQLDEFSLTSHEKALAAINGGAFAGQIVAGAGDGRGRHRLAASTPTRVCAPAAVWRALAKLKPAFDPEGVITAGNASQISDGAAALLVTTSEKARGARPDAAGARPHRRRGRVTTR